MMLALANVRELPIADNSIDLIFTDPPYPLAYLDCYDWLAKEAARVLKPGGFIAAMCGGIALNRIYRMFDEAQLEYYWQCEVGKTEHNTSGVWLGKKSFVATATKPIIVYSKGSPRESSYFVNLYYSNMPDKRYHHWGQDIGSARYYIEAFTSEGDVVLDPFIGGGTTAVACELIGRRCIGFDVDVAAIETTRARLLEAQIPTQVLMQFAEAT